MLECLHTNVRVMEVRSTPDAVRSIPDLKPGVVGMHSIKKLQEKGARVYCAGRVFS